MVISWDCDKKNGFFAIKTDDSVGLPDVFNGIVGA